MIYYTFLACFWIACLVIFFQVNNKYKYKIQNVNGNTKKLLAFGLFPLSSFSSSNNVLLTISMICFMLLKISANNFSNPKTGFSLTHWDMRHFDVTQTKSWMKPQSWNFHFVLLDILKIWSLKSSIIFRSQFVTSGRFCKGKIYWGEGGALANLTI